MSLIEIQYGSIASSSDMNNNFNYLEGLIESLGETITDKTSGFSSTVLTLNQSVQQLLDYRSSFISVGMIVPYLGAEIPTGYLLCDGSEVLVEDFEDLYDVIGDLYESSDSTLFKLPDLRERTLWGKSSALILGQSLEAKLPNIKGELRPIPTTDFKASGAFYRVSGSSGETREDGGSSDYRVGFSASRSNSIYSDSCNTVQPPAIVVNYMIKY